MNDSTKVEQLMEIVQQIADKHIGFFDKKESGSGNIATNDFISEVRRHAENVFGIDYSEQKISGTGNKSAVDFYFEDEETIVEIALNLKKSKSEYEKDIFKALLAMEHKPVTRLVFIGKPGAIKKCTQPGRVAVANWVLLHHGLTIEVYDILNNHN